MSEALETFGVARNAAGELCMEGVPLRDVAERHGTPTYVYSRSALEGAYRSLDDALRSARAKRPYQICYAVKANSNLAILNLFARLGAGFDIVSGGELQRVLAAGGAASSVVFSGLGKTRAEIELALAKGIKCFNVESEPELERINGVAASLGVRARISLRVNPDVDAKTHPYISTGLKNNKFGIAFDRALATYRRAAQLSHLDVVGVDCHIGSQLTDVAPLLEAMERIVALTDQLLADGITIHHICPGGGIGIAYQGEPTIDIAAYADALQRCLGERPLELLLEPGRMLVGNAGVLLARVEYVKPTAAKNFLVIDAAMNDLIRPSLYQAYHRMVMTGGPEAGVESRVYDVAGPVCESADVLGRDRQLAAREGDLLAILSAGAYAYVMASNYNSRPRPAEVMIDGRSAQLIRERESIEQLFA
ncbi:MAG: diaminopimelate decarboxylase, partial [Betaproteobacteria bacterium]|nr:diaminopimelate decarboxylase [Betaproteobacteria bacterium]